MSKYATLKEAIQAVIKTNANNEITGAILQSSLLSMITSLGAGYQFMGVAASSTNPGTPDQNVFYLASAGTYANFGGTTVAVGQIGIFSYNGTWNYSLFDIATEKVEGKILINRDLIVKSGQQGLLTKVYNFGKTVAFRVISNTATLGSIQIAIRSNSSITYHVVKNEMTIVSKNYDIDRLYVYVNDVTVAGNIIIEIYFGEFAAILAEIQSMQQALLGVDLLKTQILGGTKLEIGTINAAGDDIGGPLRARTVGYLRAPFFIETNSGYKILALHKYTLTNGTITHDSQVTVNNTTLSVTDDSYIYRLTTQRTDNTNILVSDLPLMIKTYKDAITLAADAIAEELPEIKQEMFLLGGGQLPIGLVQGTINAQSGQVVQSNARINCEMIDVGTFCPITVTVPDNNPLRIYMYYLYSEYGDMNSYTGYGTVQASEYKKITFDAEKIGNNKGVRIVFANASDLTVNITPADGAGITFDYMGAVPELQEQIAQITGDGNGLLYGKPQSIEITRKRNKIHFANVVSFLHSSYAYTTKNQSMAVWAGKCFCFNDTTYALNDGFCIVIDANTGNVLQRVTAIPPVVSPTGVRAAHLNNACFTDVYYDASDKYPLLLLSRGDYANVNDKIGEQMYIFRITEPSTNNFTFELIKTIIAEHDFLTTFNPSWDYDASRKMIWGHCHTQDWRWMERMSQPYRKFSGTVALFKAFGASYVCVSSNANALVAADITIRVGDNTRTVSVAAGQSINEVFPYTENPGGTCVIICSQTANAFPGLYYVYECDANGNDKKLIKFRDAIVGFAAPDLTSRETVTINNDEFTPVTYLLDDGIFQGGCCLNGKLFLPFADFATINGQPTEYTGKVILIIDPVSGYIESMVRSESALEMEGCAIWDGELYVSSHNGGATDATTTPAFQIFKYTF